jgi:hypothetical protein
VAKVWRDVQHHAGGAQRMQQSGQHRSRGHMLSLGSGALGRLLCSTNSRHSGSFLQLAPSAAPQRTHNQAQRRPASPAQPAPSAGLRPALGRALNRAKSSLAIFTASSSSHAQRGGEHSQLQHEGDDSQNSVLVTADAYLLPLKSAGQPLHPPS